MKCPKCPGEMVEVHYKGVYVDRCTSCKGIWFDTGEAERLKNEWMSEYLDSGDPEVGVLYDAVEDVRCPRCHEPMRNMYDKKQPHIWYESCEHGRFFDAGEFKDWIYLTPLDKLRDIAKGKRPGALRSA